MKAGVPWSVKGIEPEAREAAKIAARREGKTLGQWLNQKIIDASDEEDAEFAADPSFGSPASQAGTSMPQQALQIDFSPVTDALRDLVHRLERSERRSENALTGLDETLADMATRLERTERISREPVSALDGTLGELRERLEKSERGLERAELLNTDAMRTVERGLRAISNRLEETERRAEEATRRVASASSETPETVRSLQAALSDLTRRLDGAETAAQAAREQASQAVAVLNNRGGASDDAVAALERAIGNVVDHIEASDARTAKAMAALREDLEKIEKASNEAKPSVSVEAIKSLETTIAALQQNIAEVGGRLGQVETNARRDVDQIAGAIDDMGGRLDKVRDAAVTAAVEAARSEGGAATQLVSQLEQRVDATVKRLETSEQQSAQAIHTIETSVSDIAGQMREIADIGTGGKAMFAEPLAALETAIDEMAARLQTTDQRSAKALAKVEEVSDELLRKIETGGNTGDIQKIRASVENVDARLNLIEAQGRGGANGQELGFMGATASTAQPAPPPMPAQGGWTADQDDAPFGPPPPAFGRDEMDGSPFGPPPPDASQMGAPPFAPPFASPSAGASAHGPGIGKPPFASDGAGAPPRNDFLESARAAARAAAGTPGNDGARSPFAEDGAQNSGPFAGNKKSLALIAAVVGVLAIAGLVFVMMGGGPQEVAGPPDDVTVPADAMASLDDPATDAPVGDAATNEPSDTDEPSVTEAASTAEDDAASDDTASDTASSGLPDVTRAPARELPDVVTPAQASAEAATPGSSISGPTSITPRQEVDVASLPTPSAPAAAPTPTLPAPTLPAPARQTLREAAAEGDAAAQYEIGQRYANGASGLPQDNEQAAFWLTRAAEQGLAPAQYRLGTMFEKGLGVPENPTRARTWYESAAAQGNVKAMHNLAVMQAEGAGGPQDFAAAARSFNAAAAHGLADSQYNLAILHERGLGVERDLAEAYKWFAIASANGDADAGVRAEALKNSVDAAKLVDAELSARTYTPRAADPAANEVSWQASLTPPALVREAQRLLGALGYDAGPADGQPGERTLDAVRAFERDKGLAVTGRIDERLLNALQQAEL
ncbi:peptidoglycan-binding protein [Pyruvatibacter sp.]|uniref:peptidoglycan-binding protein n=1 Tax=Pyruvatibacter sp. TaxID=1981328 RepID=UPI0032EC67F0